MLQRVFLETPLNDLGNDDETSRNNIQFKGVLQSMLEMLSIQYISPFCHFRGNRKGTSGEAMNSFKN